MIVGSCGFGNTGSSVLTDLLREYDDVQVYDDFEFVLPYRVDGLQDLEYHLVKQYSKCASGDFAIKRFLESAKCYKTPFINKPCNGRKFYKISREYIDKIEQLNYYGIETADMLTGNVIRNIFAFFSKKIGMKYLEKILHKRLFLWPARKIHFSIKPERFYEETRKYINNIFIAMGANLDKPICLDQPFEGNNPEQSMKFFDDPYAVIIDRDPRDLYLEYKYITHVDAKFFPHSTVEEFILYYRKLRQDKICENNRVIRINFEEFIYEYEKTIRKLEDFLKISKHNNKKAFFIPERSAANTQLIFKHPEDKQDIEKIEKELSDFLFPFQNYSGVDTSGKSFYGAGRKYTE